MLGDGSLVDEHGKLFMLCSLSAQIQFLVNTWFVMIHPSSHEQNRYTIPHKRQLLSEMRNKNEAFKLS